MTAGRRRDPLARFSRLAPTARRAAHGAGGQSCPPAPRREIGKGVLTRYGDLRTGLHEEEW